MKELIETLEKYLAKTWIDYALVILPIVLSIVAICISISATRKQNKIALFDKKYQVVSQLKSLLSFVESITDCNSPILILCLFDSYFGTSVSVAEYDEAIIKGKARVENLKSDVLQTEFLFRNKPAVSLQEMLILLNSVIINSISKVTIDTDEIKKLSEMCKTFYETDFKKMVEETKLQGRRHK